MSVGDRIRFGTNLITFFDAGWLGLDPAISYPQWAAEFDSDPRGYFERMFDAASEAGLDGVELAPNPAGWQAALRAYGSSARFAEALSSRGLELTSSYAHGRQLIGAAMESDEGRAAAAHAFEQHAIFLSELGVDTIVSGNIARSRFGNESPDDSATLADFDRPVARDVHELFTRELNALGAITSRHGVRIAIHTDAYSVCSREEDIATVLGLTDPASIHLCLDAGHITLDGGDPVAVLRNHIDRVPTMHWKDCAAELSGHLLRGDQKERHAEMLTHFRVLGSGVVDWSSWMAVLKQNAWRGWAIEEIDNSPAPVSELRQGLAYFRDELAPIYN